MFRTFFARTLPDCAQATPASEAVQGAGRVQAVLTAQASALLHTLVAQRAWQHPGLQTTLHFCMYWVLRCCTGVALAHAPAVSEQLHPGHFQMNKARLRCASMMHAPHQRPPKRRFWNMCAVKCSASSAGQPCLATHLKDRKADLLQEDEGPAERRRS